MHFRDNKDVVGVSRSFGTTTCSARQEKRLVTGTCENSTLLRPKFGLRIFLEQISVARSSSDLSRVLDRIWVLALRLAGRIAELDLAHYQLRACSRVGFSVLVDRMALFPFRSNARWPP